MRQIALAEQNAAQLELRVRDHLAHFALSNVTPSGTAAPIRSAAARAASSDSNHDHRAAVASLSGDVLAVI